jgi:NADH:ubiquinone oxidoreductase subunit C
MIETFNLNTFLDMAGFLRNIFVKDVASFLVKKNGYLHIFLKKNSLDVINFLKKSLFFSVTQLLDFIIVDKLEINIKKNKRFEYIYVLLSTNLNFRFFVRGYLGIFESIKSMTLLFDSAN